MRIVWRHSLNVKMRNKTAVGSSINVSLTAIHQNHLSIMLISRNKLFLYDLPIVYFTVFDESFC